MNIKQWLCAAALALASAPLSAFEINAGVSGSWFNPERDGHGFALEYTEFAGGCDEGCLVAYWFTYTPEGAPLFLLGVGPVDGAAADLDLYHFSGMRFGSFMPAPVPNQELWGTVRLEFDGCHAGSASYESDFVSGAGGEFGSGTFPIERLAQVGNLDCDTAGRLKQMPRHAPGGVWSGTAVSRDYSGGDDLISAGVVAVVLDDGESYLFMPEPAVYRGVLSGEDVNASGTLDAYAGFPEDLFSGAPTGQTEVRLANAATLTELRQGPGHGRAGDLLEGSFDGAGVTGEFRLRYQAPTIRPSSMDRIARCWLPEANVDLSGAPFRIAQDGTFSFRLNNDCAMEGKASNDLARWNVYSMSGEITGCDYAGHYEGVATVIDFSQPGNDGRLLFALHGDTHSLSGDGILANDSRCD